MALLSLCYQLFIPSAQVDLWCFSPSFCLRYSFKRLCIVIRASHNFHSLWAFYLNDTILPLEDTFFSIGPIPPLPCLQNLQSSGCCLGCHMTWLDTSPIYIVRLSFFENVLIVLSSFCCYESLARVLGYLSMWHFKITFSKVCGTNITLLSSFLFWLLELWNNAVTLKNLMSPNSKFLHFYDI